MNLVSTELLEITWDRFKTEWTAKHLARDLTDRDEEIFYEGMYHGFMLMEQAIQRAVEKRYG